MYESSFGLTDRPFAAAPAPRRYYPAAAIEAARQTLARCIDRAEGAGLLIGPAGSGKSILCQVLAEEFRGRFLVALLSSGRLETRRALLQAILFELGLPYRGMDEGELRLSLVDHLAAREKKQGGLLLLIDEAHSLPLRLLEEIHHITNLVHNGQPRVRLVLAGSPVLEEHLGSSKLESFNQRIAGRCYLQSFKHEETLGYVRQAISQVGGEPEQLFTADALDAIHRATDGVPRLINQLCDHALLLACASDANRLTAAGIEEAWADLQQLPTPWNAAPGANDRPADIIEFGSLDEPAVAARLTPDPEPRLRAVITDEESLFTGEPTQRIQRIKDQLGAIDEQFQPAGTIGPEVELVFSAAEVNPFQESFAEEEVIVDRFIGKARDPLARAPVVRSAEGADISSLLAPHARGKKNEGKAPSVAAKQEAPPRPAATHQADTSVEKSVPPPVKSLPPAAIVPPIIAPIDYSFLAASIDAAPGLEADEASIEESSIDQPLIDEPTEDSNWQVMAVNDLPGGMLPINRGWMHPSEDPVMPEEAGIEDERRRSVEVQPTIRMPRKPSTVRSIPLIMHDAVELDPVGPPPSLVESLKKGRGARDEGRVALPPSLVESNKRNDEGVAEVEHAADDVDSSNLEIGPENIEPDDVDLIVVEDDPVPPTPPPTSAVRRQEYRQLFARLRRG